MCMWHDSWTRVFFCLGIVYVSCNSFLLHCVTPSYTVEDTLTGTVLDESNQLQLL